KLPDYMLPSAWQILKALPLNRNGKVDRSALPTIAAQVAPGLSYRAPSNALETQLVEVWQQVLGVPQVGVDDDFFALGGNSLLVTRVLTGARRATGATVALSAFFEAPTVAGMAAHLRLTGTDPTVLPVPGQAPAGAEWRLASPGQERLWITQALEGATHTYNSPHVWDLRGPLDVAALASAFATTIARHDVLRTVYQQRDGTVWQRVLPAASAPPVAVEDLQALDAAELRLDACPALLSRIRAESELVFDLAGAPPFAVSLLKLGSERHVLLFTVHHVASDGWSLGVLQREVSAHYAARVAARPVAVDVPTLQYADYAEWQRRLLGEGHLASQLAYWRNRLAGLVPARLDFPAPADGAQPGQSGAYSSQVAAPVLQALQTLARERGMTLFMLLVASLQVLIARHSGSKDVSVGTSVAGRSREAFESMIGFFVNQLVLRGDLSGDPSVDGFLAATRTSVIDALDHQDVPYSTLVGELASARDASRSPFFQILLVLQDFPDQPLCLSGTSVSTWIDKDNVPSKFDLTLYARQVDGRLETTWIHDRSVVSPEAVRTLSMQFNHLLGQWSLHLAGRVSQLELHDAQMRAANEAERLSRRNNKFGKLRALSHTADAGSDA
ncbi:condensation domain-containing protein, partial [Stenotrophomonas sp. NPDC077464]|uniref:condensation domain-containing protein n=1 Tax=unclassified Stenotrophomonas TaxID=196198 RepID=UPI0037CF2A7A